MSQLGFYFDSSKCTGCKTCQVACKECYQLPTANLYRKVLNYAGGSWEETAAGFYTPSNVFNYFVSMACNHCASPACVANCPTGAMQKDEDTGIVWTDHDVCIGCGTCVSVCPYGAPSINEEEGYAIKCDMCKLELTADRKPVCVMACPMRALDFGEYETLVATYGEGNVAIEPLPEPSTSPSLVLNPHPNAQASGSGVGSVVTIDDEI